MNKIKVCLLLCFSFLNTLIAQVPISNESLFLLTGHIKGRLNGVIILKYVNSLNHSVSDTARVDNGNFKFKGNINYPTRAIIQSEIHSVLFDDPNRGIIYLEPGLMTIELTEGDYCNARLKGSKTQDEYSMLELQKKSIYDQEDAIQMRLKQLQKRQRIESISREMDSLKDLDFSNRRLLRKMDLEYVKNNPNSFLTADIIAVKFQTFDDLLPSEAKEIYNKFSDKLKNSNVGQEIKTSLAALGNAAVGDYAPALIGKDINNEEVSLAKYLGNKVVLLDFWGSWCEPCRKIAPYFKEIYNANGGKQFEIIGIAYLDNMESAKQAIAEDGTGKWKQLLMTDILNHDTDDVNMRFDVRGYPTFILIDKKGKIIFRASGYNKDILNQLKALVESNI